MAEPFAVITRRAVRGDPVRVFVNDEPVAEFTTIKDADAFAVKLNKQRMAAERKLERTDPAGYWKLRCEAVEALTADLEVQLREHAGEVLSGFFDRLQAMNQRRSAGRKGKPPRRSQLRQLIVEAMRPLRAEGMTLHEALLSLAHSPSGALRLRKEGAAWHCENEDEDWPPEVLTHKRLTGLFKAAGK